MANSSLLYLKDTVVPDFFRSGIKPNEINSVYFCAFICLFAVPFYLNSRQYLRHHMTLISSFIFGYRPSATGLIFLVNNLHSFT